PRSLTLARNDFPCFVFARERSDRSNPERPLMRLPRSLAMAKNSSGFFSKKWMLIHFFYLSTRKLLSCAFFKNNRKSSERILSSQKLES
ncbi:MAG: hypothetical protein QW279_01735, partial [Candidatus Jordarchaeaceae archaeon]